MLVISGKDAFYTTISVPEVSNGTIRLELSDLKPYVGGNWETLLHSEHIVNIVDSFLKKSITDKVVQIEADKEENSEKVGSLSKKKTGNTFTENQNDNSSMTAIDPRKKVNFLSFKSKQNSNDEVFFDKPEATKQNAIQLVGPTPLENETSIDESTAVNSTSFTDESCGTIRLLTDFIMEGKLDKIQ